MRSGIKRTFLNRERISIIIIIWIQLNKNINNMFSIKPEIFESFIKNNEVKEIRIKNGTIFKKLINISKKVLI